LYKYTPQRQAHERFKGSSGVRSSCRKEKHHRTQRKPTDMPNINYSTFTQLQNKNKNKNQDEDRRFQFPYCMQCCFLAGEDYLFDLVKKKK
jgi:hypothetical protein